MGSYNVINGEMLEVSMINIFWITTKYQKIFLELGEIFHVIIWLIKIYVT